MTRSEAISLAIMELRLKMMDYRMLSESIVTSLKERIKFRERADKLQEAISLISAERD